KAAREMALERARLARRTEGAGAEQSVGGGTLALGASNFPRGGSDRWFKLASVLPIIALLAGLYFIEHLHVNSQIKAAAETDAALLSDDVPPAAYSDPGFVEFLKAPRD